MDAFLGRKKPAPKEKGDSKEAAEASGVSGGAEQPVQEKIEDDESDFSDLGFTEVDMSEDEATEGAADEEEDLF